MSTAASYINTLQSCRLSRFHRVTHAVLTIFQRTRNLKKCYIVKILSMRRVKIMSYNIYLVEIRGNYFTSSMLTQCRNREKVGNISSRLKLAAVLWLAETVGGGECLPGCAALKAPLGAQNTIELSPHKSVTILATRIALGADRHEVPINFPMISSACSCTWYLCFLR